MGIPSKYNPNWRWRRCLFAVSAVLMCGLTEGGGNLQSPYAAVSLKSLGQFPFDDKCGVDRDIPAQYRALNGKKVRLEGFMFTPNAAGVRVSDSQLVWSIRGFRGPPQVQERVFLHAPPGETIIRYDSCVLVCVCGTLHVKVMKDPDGSVYSVYGMTVDALNPEN